MASDGRALGELRHDRPDPGQTLFVLQAEPGSHDEALLRQLGHQPVPAS